MILSHLKDIKAKIEQKSINYVKLPFERPFKDKYAGRLPERILCLYSVRLVLTCSFHRKKQAFNITSAIIGVFAVAVTWADLMPGDWMDAFWPNNIFSLIRTGKTH